jgi:hypothetical protein
MIVAGAAVVIGSVNLLAVHLGKIQRREKAAAYSVLLALAWLVSFFFTPVVFFMRSMGQPFIPLDTLLMDGIIVPVEAALLGLLTVTLLYMAMRLLRRRLDLMSGVFLATVLLVLLGSLALPGSMGELPVLGDWLLPFVRQVLALGGTRGILIGVALGTLTTGLRVLFAIDRPYGGK